VSICTYQNYAFSYPYIDLLLLIFQALSDVGERVDSWIVSAEVGNQRLKDLSGDERITIRIPHLVSKE